MTIHVTSSHIEHGAICSAYTCPVALACKDAGLDAGVSESTIVIHRPDGAIDIRTPPQVVHFIREFEAGHPVNPFEFELPVPANSCSCS
jgi:hypothetical protein